MAFELLNVYDGSLLSKVLEESVLGITLHVNIQHWYHWSKSTDTWAKGLVNKKHR